MIITLQQVEEDTAIKRDDSGNKITDNQ